MIDRKLLKEITQYCEFNGISDVNSEINRLLRIGFSIEKYGSSPFEQMTKQSQPLVVSTEVIEEKELKPKRGRKKKEEPKQVNEVQQEEQVPMEEVVPKKKMRIIKNN